MVVGAVTDASARLLMAAWEDTKVEAVRVKPVGGKVSPSDAHIHSVDDFKGLLKAKHLSSVLSLLVCAQAVSDSE